MTVSAVPIRIHRFDVRNLSKIGCRLTQLSRSAVISVAFHRRTDFCFLLLRKHLGSFLVPCESEDLNVAQTKTRGLVGVVLDCVRSRPLLARARRPPRGEASITRHF